MTAPGHRLRDWPATGGPRIPVILKAAPEDFRVEEVLAFEPDGDGEHLMVQVEKRLMGTPELAGVLARLHGLPRVDVGYAGMKDRRAVARQWFSLRGVADLHPGVHAVPGVRVLATTRHSRKLRKGELSGNRFAIVLRRPGPGDVEAALRALAEGGAPNYFGAQRFGGDNLEQAARWLRQRRGSRLPAFRRGLYLSTLRSFLFNEVLAARVRSGTWRVSLSGDVPDPQGHPTGPLWGRGRSEARDAAARVEEEALAPHGSLLEGLEHAGLRQERRTLVLSAADLAWTREAAGLRVSFRLGPGQYATSFLGDRFRLQEDAACELRTAGAAL